ncbi:2-O-methyltransferase NoeI [Novipirellula aureliae]|uniref:2-O-methyltransferase NoeI n=1 Tax=Novipirellula aureliae TaxID=2527966 RepID=A0A5C6E7S1_9BACT|nr:FkbM family methyltransferase [Novipirellula aureliae]TWU43259.1 2-O-methyltransferase NoeI [Novipirellula aureliae]
MQLFETTGNIMLKFRGYKLFYQNRDAAESMVRQIDDFPSFFTPQHDRPFIVDCGANIGVSVLEWKRRWPGCEILCFEPNPHTFNILQKNIDANDIPGVRCVNAALADHNGHTTLYGDLAKQGDARGNSIDPAWGDRSELAASNQSGEVQVVCKRLSPYLKGRVVSFLKLDIEGAEQQVLTEIAAELETVEAIYVEIHETRDSLARNSVDAIEQQLKLAGFTMEAESRFDQHALPPHLDDWQKRVGASQTQVMAWRS